jgi:hypothetical protein
MSVREVAARPGIQREAITALAAQLAAELPDPGPTVRAIEHIARWLDARQLQARSEFAGGSNSSPEPKSSAC